MSISFNAYISHIHINRYNIHVRAPNKSLLLIRSRSRNSNRLVLLCHYWTAHALMYTSIKNSCLQKNKPNNVTVSNGPNLIQWFIGYKNYYTFDFCSLSYCEHNLTREQLIYHNS